MHEERYLEKVGALGLSRSLRLREEQGLPKQDNDTFLQQGSNRARITTYSSGISWMEEAEIIWPNLPPKSACLHTCRDKELTT